MGKQCVQQQEESAVVGVWKALKKVVAGVEKKETRGGNCWEGRD